MDPTNRPAKFKDSCDNCAQAKVRCSRDRPSCQRCVRSRLACRYSLARRGKPVSRQAINLTKSPPVLPKASRYCVNSLAQGLSSSNIPGLPIVDQEPRMSADYMSSEANLSNPSALSDRRHSVTNYAEDISSSVPDFAFLDEAFPLSTDFMPGQTNTPKSPVFSPRRHSVNDLAEDFSNHAFNLTSIDDESPVSGDSLTSRAPEVTHMGGMAQRSYLAPHESCLDFSLLSRLGDGGTNKRGVYVPTTTAVDSALLALSKKPTESQLDDKTSSAAGSEEMRAAHPSANIQVVLSTLKSLHVSSIMPAPGIDIILTVTSMAIRNLSGLLKEPNGLNSPDLILLTLVCCNGIIDAYRQFLLCRRTPPSGSDEQNHCDNATDCCSTTAAIARDMPVCVGEFRPDSSVKRNIVSSVILSEVTRVGNIIERIIQSSKSRAISAGRGMKEGGDFLTTLEPLLKDKLRATLEIVRAEIVDFEDI